MQETVYTSGPLLQNSRQFLLGVQRDLQVMHHVSWRLLVRQLTLQTRQSLLGSTAMLLPPLVASLVWIFLGQAKVVNVQTGQVPYPLFVLTGLFLWQHFLEAFNCPLQQLLSARTTLAKVRVPHEAYVAAGAAVVMLNSTVRLVITVGLMGWFHVPLTGAFALAPLGLLILLVLGVALGWLVAPLGLLYADMPAGLAMIMNLWF